MAKITYKLAEPAKIPVNKVETKPKPDTKCTSCQVSIKRR